jgi:predicted phosphodiesterase
MRDLPDTTSPEGVSQVSRQFLERLPLTQTVETSAGTLLLCHGMGENDMRPLNPHDEGYVLESNTEFQELLGNDALRFVVCGHTHRRMVRDFGRLTVVNPGPLSDVLRLGTEIGFGVADFETNAVQFYDFFDGHVAQTGERVPLSGR